MVSAPQKRNDRVSRLLPPEEVDLPLTSTVRGTFRDDRAAGSEVMSLILNSRR